MKKTLSKKELEMRVKYLERAIKLKQKIIENLREQIEMSKDSSWDDYSLD